MEFIDMDGQSAISSPVGPALDLTTARINHLGVQTTDLDNCVSWYREFFGCTVSWSLDKFSELTLSRLPGISTLVELRSGGVRFHVFDIRPGRGEATPPSFDQFQHCCLEVTSVAELRRWREHWLELYERGDHTFASDEVATEIVVDSDGVHSFYALDVNGLEYEFTWMGGAGDE